MYPEPSVADHQTLLHAPELRSVEYPKLSMADHQSSLHAAELISSEGLNIPPVLGSVLLHDSPKPVPEGRPGTARPACSHDTIHAD